MNSCFAKKWHKVLENYVTNSSKVKVQWLGCLKNAYSSETDEHYQPTSAQHKRAIYTHLHVNYISHGG